jgi:hypothetical protein
MKGDKRGRALRRGIHSFGEEDLDFGEEEAF